MKRTGRLLALGAWVVLSIAVSTAEPREPQCLVLVSATGTDVPGLSYREIRKLFLGIPLEKGQLVMTPLLNESDALLHEVFLQKVIFMSARHYERQLLARVFRYGGQRPPRYENAEQLLSALQNTPGAVTYMWAETAADIDNVQIVGKLWEGYLK